MIDKVNYGVSAGAIFSPWWLPALKTISETAALLVPILGVVWLAVQILTKLLGK